MAHETLLQNHDASPESSDTAGRSAPSPTPNPSGSITQADAPSPDDRADRRRVLLELLVQVTLRLRLRGVDLESSTGLSGRELDLVALLSASGPTSVKSLVADLGLPRSTMTAIVDRLQARHLVKRRPNPEDRRSVILEATPSALDALLRYREGMESFTEHIQEVLSDEEQTQFVRLMQKMAHSF
ncbi:MAG TPA: MarR family transcriptional regulator [Deltaproteobacteria bacterium]|nr:MarR family transcriptional regulator [Deltaproteobacteria bacterium]